MTVTDPTPPPSQPDPRALARRISWLLAIVGAVFTPMGLTLAVYALFAGGVGIAVLAVAMFMFVPAAVFNFGVRGILRRQSEAFPGALTSLTLWLWGIGVMVVGAAALAGMLVVLFADVHHNLDAASAGRFAATVAGMIVIGALGAAAMVHAWSGFFGRRMRANPGLVRTMLIGAALLGGLTVLLALLVYLDSSMPFFTLVIFTALGGGAWMGLVGYSALRDLPRGHPPHPAR